MRIHRSLLPITIVALLAGCAPAMVSSYDAPLVKVQRPADVEARWGEYTIEPTDSSGYAYSDELLDMTVVPARGSFFARLENKTDHTLRVIWDEGAYVGPNGVSSRIVNGNTRVIDMEREQPPTVVPAHASAVLNIIPTDLYHVSTGAYTSNWTDDFVSYCGTAADYEGKTFRLMLPIQVQETVNEYTLEFMLSNVQMPELSDFQRNANCR